MSICDDPKHPLTFITINFIKWHMVDGGIYKVALIE